MPAYEYICLGCERPFEHQRPMTASVQTQVACPSCGDERVRRRFSFIASTSPGDTAGPAPRGGCACGGACACGH